MTNLEILITAQYNVRYSLAEEIADVKIMLKQIEIMHGGSFAQLVSCIESEKIERLAKKLEEAKC